jgi:hypothetical protein
MGITILGIVLGAIIAIISTIITEMLRKPDLRLEVVPPVDMVFQGQPANQMRAVRLKLTNTALPSWARWMSRNAALQCHGNITFHHLDGQNVFGRSMHIRWASAPEPVPIRVQIGNQEGLIFDSTKFTLSQRIDVYPGESAELDVAVRLDSEPNCYGWSNENYFSNPLWRIPAWMLQPGRYIVRVNVFSAGETCTALFRLINDVPQHDFRIEKPLSTDAVRE